MKMYIETESGKEAHLYDFPCRPFCRLKNTVSIKIKSPSLLFIQWRHFDVIFLACRRPCGLMAHSCRHQVDISALPIYNRPSIGVVRDE